MFSKKPAAEPQFPTAAKPQGRTMAGNSTFSVIGADVTIKGDVSASADLHVDGRVEGDITCASLVQGETSTIEGSIEAEVARLSGRVTGSIRARELIILRSAQVEGDVHYDALTIEQGAQVDGRFSHREPGKAGAKPAAPATGDDEPKLTLAS
jgi:cytoskeletal protein CcmA (bactofilin family)